MHCLLFPTTTLQGSYFYPHPTDEEQRPSRGQCAAQGLTVSEWDLSPGGPGSAAWSPCHYYSIMASLKKAQGKCRHPSMSKHVVTFVAFLGQYK